MTTVLPHVGQATARQTARTQDMISGPIGRTLARLAAPNVLAMVVQALMSIAEGMFASRLGVDALAGLALVFPLVMLTQMLSAGAMGGAISSAVARALGAGNRVRASGVTLAALILACGFAVGSFGLMSLLGEAIFDLLGGGGASADAALEYATVFFSGSLTIWLCNAMLSIVRGTGGMMFASLTLLSVSIITIPLAGAFALGWGGMPALGMAGLALGTVMAYGVGAVLAFGFLLSGRTGFRLREGRLSLSIFCDILQVGVIASINSLLTVLTIVLMVALVGRHGEAALAGYGLGARLEFLMIPVVFGIGAAMTAMVGANIGAGQKDRALRIAWTGSFAAAGIVGTIGLIVALFPDLWLRIFLAAEDTGPLGAGRTYFQIVAPFYGFFAVGLALYFASQGAGRMLWPFLGGVLRICIAFGGAILLGPHTGLGVASVFIAIAAGMFAYGAFIVVALWRTRWR